MKTPKNRQAFDAWVSQFPREEIEQQIRETEALLERLRSSLALVDKLAKDEGAANGQPPTKPEAIMAILRQAPGTEMVAGEIHRQMVGRGWLPDGDPHRKRFYATLSRMAKATDGRLMSSGRGIYALGPNAEGRTA